MKIKNMKDVIKTFPLEPGVYIMKNADQKIIYIGKAKKLKNRVSSYFNNNIDKSSKVGKLVSKIDNIDFIVTSNELEALILECNLIKKYKPLYNILLKDDKGYKFIKISPHPYSKITVVNKKNKDKSIYIGPYMSNFAASEIVRTVCKIFKLPTCNRELFQKNKYSRPCLNYYIGLCSAPCCNYISVSEYKNNIDEAVKYIKSGMKPFLRQLQQKMKEESERLNFEVAAKIRDRIRMIEKVSVSENVMIWEYKDLDVLAAVANEDYICATLLIFRDYKLIDKKQCIVSKEEDIAEVRKMMLLEFFMDENYQKPQVVFLDEKPKDFELLKGYIFKDIKVILGNKRGLGKVIEMAKNNSRERIIQEIKLMDKEIVVLKKVKDLLGLTNLPRVIEAYDISNFGSKVNVGAMVVFKDGNPKKAGYRRFKIKDIQKQDDYGSMRQVIKRRFRRYKEGDEEFGERPDLILIDGGHNHVSEVKKVLRGYGLEISVYGMVKDDKHTTDSLVNFENVKIDIKKDQQIYLFIKWIQDEIHRFAINYSRRLQNKMSIDSELSKIRGVGKVRQQILIKEFKDLEGIKGATFEELSGVKGISKEVARSIFEYFNKKED